MKRKSKAIKPDENISPSEKTGRENVENSNISFRQRNENVNNRINSILGLLRKQTAIPIKENGAYSPNLPKATHPTFDGEDETRLTKLKRQWEEFDL